MIKANFLSSQDRQELELSVQDSLSPHCYERRANAAYHHAKIVKAWLKEPKRRIKLRFIPVSCPHLNPIERLWGVMHKNITHNQCYASLREFAMAIFTFLRDTVPKNWQKFCDQITDNFRSINPNNFQLLK